MFRHMMFKHNGYKVIAEMCLGKCLHAIHCCCSVDFIMHDEGLLCDSEG